MSECSRVFRTGSGGAGVYLLFFGAMSPVFAQGSETGVAGMRHDLIVTISGVEQVVGELRIGVFDSARTFVGSPVVSAVVPVLSQVLEWRVTLPEGEYAIAVIHDEDGNGELNTNFLGIPQERYGFSNKARGRFGAPAFEDASFALTSSPHLQVVEVR